MEHRADDKRTEFNRLFVTLADAATTKTGKTQKELAADLGVSRQLFWSGANERRSVGYENLVQLIEMADWGKAERSEILIAWLIDRMDSGALGAALVVLVDAIDEHLSKDARQRVLVRAVEAYTKALETKRK